MRNAQRAAKRADKNKGKAKTSQGDLLKRRERDKEIMLEKQRAAEERKKQEAAQAKSGK